VKPPSAELWFFCLQRNEQGDENVLVDLALQALEMLANITKAPSQSEGELGQALTNGELPHAQACVLYIVRVGVIEQLGEQGQVWGPYLET
jgi:hypothetical protein